MQGHPKVRTVSSGDGPPIAFREGSWSRSLWQGRPDVGLFGLVELMDNNPIVCADEVSVPSPAGTLALIALGPLARAALLSEPPVLMLSFEASEDEIAAALRSEGFDGGATFHVAPQDLGRVRAATALAKIPMPEDMADLDALYEEAFGRSFFVRRNEDSEWDVALVHGKPHAVYRMAVTPGEPDCLLRIQVMADAEGKCGAAQLVHAFNVMIGCEETLGL